MAVNINIPKPIIDYNDLENKPTIPSVAGANGEIQFNNGGVFGASSKLKYANGTLEIEGSGSTAATTTQIWRNLNQVILLRLQDDGQIRARTTSVSNPAYSFIDAPTSGFYHFGGGIFGVVNNGQYSVLFGSGGITTHSTVVNSVTAPNLGLNRFSSQHRLAVWLNPEGDTQFEAWEANVGFARHIILNWLGGNVGIGTASPTSKLQVKGSGSTSATATQIWQNSSNVELMRVSDNGAVSGNGTLTFTSFITTSASFIVKTSGGLLFEAATFGLYDNNGVFIIGNWNTGNQSLRINRTTGNVSIGDINPVASAILDVNSTTKGFLPPRMTTTQKNAITSPATGLVVYDTTTDKLCCYNGSTWNDLF